MHRQYYITDIFPIDRNVEIGGKPYSVKEITLGDIAAFTRWVATRKPHPLEAIRGELDGMDDAARKKALQRAYKEADPWWGASLGDPAYHEAMDTPEGLLVYLAVVLRDNELTVDELVSLANVMTKDEFRAIQRAAAGRDPHKEIRGILQDEEGGTLDWAKVIDDISQVHPAWTLDYIASLTIAQAAFAKNGVVDEFGGNIAPQVMWARMQAERELLFGEDG